MVEVGPYAGLLKAKDTRWYLKKLTMMAVVGIRAKKNGGWVELIQC